MIEVFPTELDPKNTILKQSYLKKYIIINTCQIWFKRIASLVKLNCQKNNILERGLFRFIIKIYNEYKIID